MVGPIVVQPECAPPHPFPDADLNVSPLPYDLFRHILRCRLIMAPVFFSAWDYTLLGVAIRKLGPQYSVLRPRYYLILFLTIDVLSLVLQAIGGGKASSSAATGVPTQSATNIMVVGIVIQMVAMFVFVALALDFILRASARRPYAFQVRRLERKAQLAMEKNAEEGEGRPAPDHGGESQTTIVASSSSGVPKLATADAEKAADRARAARETGDRTAEELEEERKNLRSWWILMIAVVISSVMILLRGFFRSIELSEGWTSHLATTEGFTIGLDAAPMVIAVGIFNILNPAFLLPRPASWKSL